MLSFDRLSAPPVALDARWRVRPRCPMRVSEGCRSTAFGAKRPLKKAYAIRSHESAWRALLDATAVRAASGYLVAAGGQPAAAATDGWPMTSPVQLRSDDVARGLCRRILAFSRCQRGRRSHAGAGSNRKGRWRWSWRRGPLWPDRVAPTAAARGRAPASGTTGPAGRLGLVRNLRYTARRCPPLRWACCELVVAKRSPSRARAKTIDGARPSEMPTFIKPQLAVLKSRAPKGEQWLHEIKFDGYRVQVHLNKGNRKVYTRNGLDWTKRFSQIAGALDIPSQAIIDGEVVVIHEGRTNFSEL
jgi:ATP dependent DNA ligase domain